MPTVPSTSSFTAKAPLPRQPTNSTRVSKSAMAFFMVNIPPVYARLYIYIITDALALYNKKNSGQIRLFHETTVAGRAMFYALPAVGFIL